MRLGHALLLIALLPIFYADRSLTVASDKSTYSLGETVTIIVQLGNEKCREHDHYLDIYIYDSTNILVHQVYLEYSDGIGLKPTDFPVKVKYSPLKPDVYIVKLWVLHGKGWGHPNWYLEDTTTYRVTTQVLTTYTSTSTVTATTVSTSRVVSSTTASAAPKTTIPVTSTPAQSGGIWLDSIMPIIAAVAAIIALALTVVEVGKRRDRA